MNKHNAANIINKNHLIPGPISKKILTAIINDDTINLEEYKTILSEKQFYALKKDYQLKKESLLKYTRKHPKYFPFYLLIHEKTPQVSWDITFDSCEKASVTLCAPRVNNLRLSLLSLLLRPIDVEADSSLMRRYTCAEKFPTRMVKLLSDFMSRAKAIYPDPNNMRLIFNWLLTCINGEEATIFIPICPAYAVEPTGDPTCPFRHTFDSVGSGLGPTAQKILDILPLLRELLSALNIQPKIFAGIADFEAFSPDNLKTLKITEEEFLKRVRLSKECFEEKSSIKTMMISELLGGKEQWLEALTKIITAFSANHFGFTQINASKLVEIAKKRKSLYAQWYGEKPSLKDYVPYILEQGAGYSVMGTVFSECFKNCFILGADAHVFTPFYSFLRQIPVLYFKKYYC